MHGFIGGRTWVTVAYHYDLARRTPPTLLFRQPGHVLHKSSRVAVHAIPKKPDDRLRAQLLPSAGRGHRVGDLRGQRPRSGFSWTATHAGRTCRGSSPCGRRPATTSRSPCWSTSTPGGATSCDGAGATPTATFAPLPPGTGPMSDAETMWLTASGDVVEVWSTDARGLEIRRHSPNGKVKVSSLAPLPPRTPRDRPLFNIAGVMERARGDLFLHWGEYLVLAPGGRPGPPPRPAHGLQAQGRDLQPAPPRPLSRRDVGRHRFGQDPRPDLPAPSRPRGADDTSAVTRARRARSPS